MEEKASVSCYDRDMENSLKARITDLDRTADKRDITKATSFLSAAEVSEALGLKRELLCGRAFLTGGYPEAERKRMIFPASYEETEGLEERFIACVKAEPVSEKFSEELTHRDFLGALMNLGIERDCLGDIRMEKNTAFIFVTAEMSDTVLQELARVKHTAVTASKVPLSEGAGTVNVREEKINVASERLDAIVAAAFKLSRSEAASLITAEKVFLDGKAAPGNSARLAEGMKISVRGMGKFVYEGIENESRKGRLFVKIGRYV